MSADTELPAIQGYRVIRELGSGGFGVVYLAHDQDGNEVAIKTLTKIDEFLLDKFTDEARRLHSLNSNPFVVDFIDYQRDHNPPYITMEYCSEGTLDELIKRQRSWPEILTALLCAASGLKHLHDGDGYHRDIKPSNMLITYEESENGRQLVVKLSDFGLARMPEVDQDTVTNSPWGTDAYKAPEIKAKKDYTTAADIYSLGITGIELITTSQDPASLDGVEMDERVRQLLESMVHQNSNKRPNITKVINVLAEIIDPEKIIDEEKKSKSIVGIGGLLLGGLIAFGVVAVGVGFYKAGKAMFGGGKSGQA